MTGDCSRLRVRRKTNFRLAPTLAIHLGLVNRRFRPQPVGQCRGPSLHRADVRVGQTEDLRAKAFADSPLQPALRKGPNPLNLAWKRLYCFRSTARSDPIQFCRHPRAGAPFARRSDWIQLADFDYACPRTCGAGSCRRDTRYRLRHVVRRQHGRCATYPGVCRRLATRDGIFPARLVRLRAAVHQP